MTENKRLIERALKLSEEYETPLLIIDKNIIRNKIKDFKQHIDTKSIYYAVKANSDKEVLKLMDEEGLSFEASSIFEIRKLLDLRINPDRISFGNTIKKRSHIKEAYSKGIKVFTTDSIMDIENLIELAPGSKLIVRIELETYGKSSWPLNKKFGTDLSHFSEMIELINHSDLEFHAFSFHVGSQQLDKTSWHNAFKRVQEYNDILLNHNLKLNHLNIGGGFPAKYDADIDSLKNYFKQIELDLIECGFGDCSLTIEPGRGLVGEAGIIISEVVQVVIRDDIRWVYTDVGKYNGLISTINEAIIYDILDLKSDKKSEVILAGPTCDSSDILYENHKHELSESLTCGDKLVVMSTGAYTRDYSSISFNGLPPLNIKVIDTY